MTTTSGYSGQLGGRSSRCESDRDHNASLPGYQEAHTKIAREAPVAAVAAAVAVDGSSETVHDDERQTVCDDRLGPPMGSAV
jgi:hypothetical protein